MMRRPTLRSVRWKFDHWVARHLFPQRAFITFGPTACMANVDVQRNSNGDLELVLRDDALLQDIHGYDVLIVGRGVGGLVIGNQLFNRHPSPYTSLVSLEDRP